MNFEDSVKNYGSHIKLEESIENAHGIFKDFLNNNDLDDALRKLDHHAFHSIYHSFYQVFLLIFNSMNNLDKINIKRTERALNRFNRLLQKHHGRNYFKVTNYRKLTDLQRHAMLVNIFYFPLRAGFTLGNFREPYHVFKIVENIYHGHKMIRKVNLILTKAQSWQSDTSEKTFHDGYIFFTCFLNLLASQIPIQARPFCNLIGYTGDENDVIEKLFKLALDTSSYFSNMAQLTVILYCLYWKTHYGISTKYTKLVQIITNEGLKQNPKAFLYLSARAKLEQINGNIDSAIKIYTALIRDKRVLCYGYLIAHEFIFSNALKGQWDEAIEGCDYILLNHTAHYPAYVPYFKAVLLFLKRRHNMDNVLGETDSQIMKVLPLIKQRNFGPIVTLTQMVSEKSKNYFENGHFLILPELDLFYQNNLLEFIRGNHSLIYNLMERVEQELKNFQEQMSEFDKKRCSCLILFAIEDGNTKKTNMDYYLSALFYKGVLNKICGDFVEAQDIFLFIIDRKRQIYSERSIIFQCYLELGLINMEIEEYSKAKEWFKKCAKLPNNYSNQFFVYIRANAGLKHIENLKNDQELLEKLNINLYESNKI